MPERKSGKGGGLQRMGDENREDEAKQENNICFCVFFYSFFVE